jgi:hypothetical protein
MSFSSEPAWDVLEARLQRVLGPAANTSAQNTDRLRTWGTFFREPNSPDARHPWSYHDELAVHAQDSRADSDSAPDLDQCDALLNQVNGNSEDNGGVGREQGSVVDSGSKCRFQAAQSVPTRCKEGSAVLPDARDEVSAAGLFSASPPKKRIRREFEKAEENKKLFKAAPTTAGVTSWTSDRANCPRSSKERTTGLSEDGSGSESGATSSENSEDSSVSSGASGLRRMRERIRRCKRELQMTQQTRRSTSDVSNRLIGEESDPSRLPVSGGAVSGASISNGASERHRDESSQSLGAQR